MTWQSTDTAPRDGTPFLAKYTVDSNDILGWAPWRQINVVIAWWEGSSWSICFMYDGAADTEGYSSQFFFAVPVDKIRQWMPLPE